MALPGSAPVLANSPKMFDFARRSGRRIVEMVLGGSQAARHPDARARSATPPRRCWRSAARSTASSICRRRPSKPGVDVDVFQLFNDLGEQVPVLSAVAPNGSDTIEAFEAAGGARALMKQLEPLLDLDALTVTGRTVRRQPRRRRRSRTTTSFVRSSGRSRQAARSSCCTDRSRPKARSSSSACADPARTTRFDGHGDRLRRRASRRSQAIAEGRASSPGTCSSLRGMGPKGGPGMAGPASRVVFAHRRRGTRATRSRSSRDGQLSGLCNKGITVAEVSPESAVGGPLVARRERRSHPRSTSTRARSISTCPKRSSIARASRRGEPALPKSNGYLSIYQRSVQPMSTGAVLDRTEVVQAFRPAVSAGLSRHLARSQNSLVRKIRTEASELGDEVLVDLALALRAQHLGRPAVRALADHRSRLAPRRPSAPSCTCDRSAFMYSNDDSRHTSSTSASEASMSRKPCDLRDNTTQIAFHRP